MESLEIKPGIHWVGGIDWDLRNFHGYLTQRGSTYNAYLIVDEKIALIDTVKSNKIDEMITRIRNVVDPAKIDYVVSNHVEMDHSGGISEILRCAPKAELITSPHGQSGLQQHFGAEWNYRIVKTGESLPLGKHTVQFVQTPMVHWPDSMVSYVPEAKLLLSNDAFGQHIATSERFDDEVGWEVVRYEAAKYYANIVMPYGKQVNKALQALSSLTIETIAPSHGVIWRENIPRIVEEYTKWARAKTERRAVIVYDSMWGSTEKLAHALQRGLEREGLPVAMRNLRVNHISDVMYDVLHCQLVLLGSPTLNNTYLPTMGAFLTYLRGLRPANRLGFVFGSYGWGGQAVGQIEEELKMMQWQLPREGFKVNYVPGETEIAAAENEAQHLAKASLG